MCVCVCWVSDVCTNELIPLTGMSSTRRSSGEGVLMLLEITSLLRSSRNMDPHSLHPLLEETKVNKKREQLLKQTEEGMRSKVTMKIKDSLLHIILCPLLLPYLWFIATFLFPALSCDFSLFTLTNILFMCWESSQVSCMVSVSPSCTCAHCHKISMGYDSRQNSPPQF